MYLHSLEIKNFRSLGTDDTPFNVVFNRGLSALVGENDSGKTSIVDAIRYALGTTDSEWLKIDDTDFSMSDTSKIISIKCQFRDLNSYDKRSFLEHLTYEESGNEVLYLVWTVKENKWNKGRSYRKIEVHSGQDGQGPAMSSETRALLATTYLKPLRDAGRELSAGKSSRLSQILENTAEINNGTSFDKNEASLDDIDKGYLEKLSFLSIGDLANWLLTKHASIKTVTSQINDYLEKIDISGQPLFTDISVGINGYTEQARLRNLLEKLMVGSKAIGRLGLGSENLIFICCELLLLANEYDGFKCILIEEPEAHLHAQRQLQLITFLQEIAYQKNIQIIITTHSPNLAASIKTENLILVENSKAFSLQYQYTKLNRSDYRFLNRFLDTTRSNLFFARGVLIVEGDAENILLPTLAKKAGYDLAKEGVSIVNVGSTGLGRYARIFMREDQEDGQINIPVACLVDMDVMPACAPKMLEKIKEGETPSKDKKWLSEDEFTSEELNERKQKLIDKANEQNVKTFVSDKWTFEYDLSFSGLSKEVFIAAYFAKKDDTINNKNTPLCIKYCKNAIEDYAKRQRLYSDPTQLSTCIYKMFDGKGKNASKAIAAQYLAEYIENCMTNISEEDFKAKLPLYLVEAFDHVTRK